MSWKGLVPQVRISSKNNKLWCFKSQLKKLTIYKIEEFMKLLHLQHFTKFGLLFTHEKKT